MSLTKQALTTSTSASSGKSFYTVLQFPLIHHLSLHLVFLLVIANLEFLFFYLFQPFTTRSILTYRLRLKPSHCYRALILMELN